MVKDDGTKESLSRKIVIKDVPKQLQISASVATGIAGKTVEFSTQGTVGQVEKYTWDFGDGTEAASEPNPVHTFVRAGKYEVKATVTYVDGTIRTAEMEFVVE